MPTFLEMEQAKQAVQGYLGAGPVLPPESMHLDRIHRQRAAIVPSDDPFHHVARGWLAVEAAIVSGDATEIDFLMEEAEADFDRAAGLYDPTVPQYIGRAKLEAASLPVYEAWAKQEKLGKGVLKTYLNRVAAVGAEVQEAMRATYHDDKTLISTERFLPNILAMQAYNRRHTDAGSVVGSVAVPSTLRQRIISRPGSVDGQVPKSHLAGSLNWSTTILGLNELTHLWGVTDRLQVREPGAEETNRRGDATCADGVTFVGTNHMLGGPDAPDTLDEALAVLEQTLQPGAKQATKRKAAAITRQLNERIASHRLAPDENPNFLDPQKNPERQSWRSD